MLNVTEFWKPMLPPWMMANLHDQILMPKINQAVEDWDPLSDEIPIHSWIHPWLPQLGANLEIVYPTIRRKLANALQQWHPRDVSGKQILAPWVGVFSKGSMDTFLLKNIVPKLQSVMQELLIHPTCQIMEPWHWVMQWADLLPVKAIVGVLEAAFLPRWLQFLMTWLNQFPNFEEVQNWYTWWRAQFQEPIMGDPVVVHNLQKALEMIGTALQCPGQPMDYSFIINRPMHQPQQQPLPPPPQHPIVTPELMADALRMTSQIPHGYRDLVRMKCEELGIMFFPVANKHYEGKQVYKCGNLFIYISANVIYAQADGRNWVPVSLQHLLQAAVS
jgi:tuftelin-interacting protein 11